MTRSRRLHVWTLALWGVCLLTAAGGHLASPRHVAPANEAPAALGVLSRAPDAAVIPAGVADEVRAASQGAPLRLLILTAVLATLAGVPALLGPRLSAAGRVPHPLRTRRYAIALRAPPLQFA